MNLYYILLELDYDDYIGSNNELRYEFQQKQVISAIIYQKPLGNRGSERMS
ncbi:hypothetical protein BSYN_18740 [Bacteroides sedimenti]|uniref:Uncharacterized protein n=1 Tax=Bacteroides sedimenti TaxID=2136147 RepID=A0ABN6ZBV6_9BACE